MSDLLLLFLAGGIFILTPSLVGGSVSGNVVYFSEIAWMGTLPKEGESSQAASNNEWIELYNPTNQEISLAGWKIIASDGSPNITLSGSIKPQDYFMLERGNDEILPNVKADLIYSFKDNALSNSGEHLFLKDSSGNIIDEINGSPGWPAGDNENKNTMQKSGGNWATNPATPNSGWADALVISGGNTSQQAASALSTNPQQSIIYPSINAYAGEDKIAIAGSEIDFLGQAWNTSQEPLEGIRFWWNFGDGESKEGKVASHIFQMPGKYTVGLHVSSGSSAASDYSLVEVIANQLEISGVLLGEKGYFKLYNPSDFLLDIGGWIVQSASGKQFVIPIKTKIGPKAEIALANSTTQLFIEDKEPGAKILYPNGVLALEWKGDNTSTQQSVGATKITSAIYSPVSKIPKIIKEDPSTQIRLNLASATISKVAGIGKTPLKKPKTSLFWLAGILSFAAAVGYVLISRWKKQKS